jgi:hypothetical protein
VISNAVKVTKIATGEEPEHFGADVGKDKAAQSPGQRGGKARPLSTASADAAARLLMPRPRRTPRPLIDARSAR